ncbi:galactose-3-O-sulfotransferase 2-like [Lineus longissimus]|uniref:galactose-3-O-sulfotransferase 2-like n=1 Tax=Lineus longissimus TaxID=88925 RepID=UPI00315DBCC9
MGSIMLYAWMAPMFVNIVTPNVVSRGTSLQTISDRVVEQASATQQTIASKFTTVASNLEVYALSGTCRPSNNVVLIKVHKCASSTIANIFTRYGLKHHRNFALPRHDVGHIGWPLSLLPKHIEPIGKNQQINFIAHHVTYNETTLTNLMPSETKYFTILREPFSQLKSVMYYFDIETKNYNFKTKDRVGEFLSNPQFYERDIPFVSNGFVLGNRSMTLNFMSTDLGFENDWRTDENKINEFITNIDKKIDLVLIREHFVESVVLMRRLLCWSLEDVVYLILNKQKYTKNTADEVSEEETLRTKFRAWSRVDFLLYEYFNRTLWDKIAQQGPDFWSEIGVCTMVNQLVTLYCAGNKTEQTFIVPETMWNKKFEFKAQECRKLKKGPHLFNREIGMMMGLPRFSNLNPYAKELLPPWPCC